MREQDERKESIFRQSVEAEKNKEDLFEKEVCRGPAQGQGRARRQAAARIRPGLTAAPRQPTSSLPAALWQGRQFRAILDAPLPRVR